MEDPGGHDVRIGSDGWLFLTGGSNGVLPLYSDAAEFSSAMAEDWAAIIAQRAELAASLNARYLHVVAPEKLCIYPDMASLQFPLRRPATVVARRLVQADIFLDLFDVLNAVRALTPAYMKTDSHWTWSATKSVFRAICGRLGLSGVRLPDDAELFAYEGVFDLGAKLSPPVAETNVHRNFSPTITRVRANRAAELWDYNAAAGLPIEIHNSLSVSYHNAAPHALDEVIVLFGDSFLDFRSMNITGLFAECFRDVHFVWSTNLDRAYVAALRPTILVTETAERFMRAVPRDDYDVEADLARRLAALANP